jgi:hypothetical protein
VRVSQAEKKIILMIPAKNLAKSQFVLLRSSCAVKVEVQIEVQLGYFEVRS